MYASCVGGSVASLRNHNQALVLRQIIRSPGLSRSEIATRVGLTEAAVSRITRDLIGAGLVQEGDVQPALPGQRGRRHIQLAPARRGACFLGVSLTISDRRVAVIDLSGARLAERSLPSELPQSYRPLVAEIVMLARELLRSVSVPRRRLLGLGAVTSGAVDPVTGQVSASSLEVLGGQDVGRDLASGLGVPVVVETVGNAIGAAEAYLIGRGGATELTGPTLVVHVAFGIGTTLLLDGAPVRTGADERLAGHILLPGNSDRCICGAHGCMMTRAAGYGLLQRFTRAPQQSAPRQWRDLRPDLVRAAIAEANAGSGALAAQFREAGQTLGRELFAIGAATVPRHVILGGPVPTARDYVDGVSEGLAETFARAGFTSPRLIVSDVDYLHAAELLALAEFALVRPLDLRRLIAA